MRNPIHIILGSILLLLTSWGCSKHEEETSFIYNIDEEFVIRPVENLNSDTNKLALIIQSLLPSTCHNSEIVYQYHHINETSIIDIDDIINADNCIDIGSSPAIEVALDDIDHNTRKLIIRLKGVIENDGQIDESANRYELKMNATNGIKISHRELLKIEPRMIWGGVDYDHLDSRDAAETFIGDIRQMSQSSNLEEGYYGHYELMPNNEVIIWNDPQTLQYRLGFSVDSNLSSSEISGLIANYRARYPELRFFAYNGIGESF